MPQGPQLLQFVHEFVEQYSAELKLQEKTVKNKRNAINRFLLFLGERTFDIHTTREYLYFLTSKHNKASSINAELKVLRAFCAFLVDREYIQSNFVKKIKYLKVNKFIRPYPSEELAEAMIIAGTEVKNDDNKLARSVKKDTRLALRFMLRTGLRINETISIKGRDFNLDAEDPYVVITSKGGDQEKQLITPDIISELLEVVQRDRAFQITERGCNRTLQRGAKAVGFDKMTMTVHSLRHIFALTRLRRGEPLQLVSRLLRHSSIRITDDYYSHYLLSDLVPAINNSGLVRKRLSRNDKFHMVNKIIQRQGLLNDETVRISSVFMEDGKKQILIEFF